VLEHRARRGQAAKAMDYAWHCLPKGIREPRRLLWYLQRWEDKEGDMCMEAKREDEDNISTDHGKLSVSCAQALPA
jgi:hypothetical protein